MGDWSFGRDHVTLHIHHARIGCWGRCCADWIWDRVLLGLLISLLFARSAGGGWIELMRNFSWIMGWLDCVCHSRLSGSVGCHFHQRDCTLSCSSRCGQVLISYIAVRSALLESILSIPLKATCFPSTIRDCLNIQQDQLKCQPTSSILHTHHDKCHHPWSSSSIT